MTAEQDDILVIILSLEEGSEVSPGQVVAGASLISHSIRYGRSLGQTWVVSPHPAAQVAAAQQNVASLPLAMVDLGRIMEVVSDQRRQSGLSPARWVLFLGYEWPVRDDAAIRKALAMVKDGSPMVCGGRKPISPTLIPFLPDAALMGAGSAEWVAAGGFVALSAEQLSLDAAVLKPRIDYVEITPAASLCYRHEVEADLIAGVLGRATLEDFSAWPEQLRLVVFDFDGVMTDNRVLTMETGEEAVFCDRGDGMGISMLRKAGIPAMVLSTEQNPVVAMRCRKLRLEHVHGIDDKGAWLRAYFLSNQINSSHVAYLGNDVNDFDCLQAVGLPVVPADCHPAVLPLARVVLRQCGGRGAVREFCDLALRRYAPSIFSTLHQ